MTEHPRETTIELYVLGSETLSESDRDAIQRHIDRCHGCRALAERIGDFYGDLQSELGNSDRHLPVPSPEELPTKIRQAIGPRGGSRPVVHEVDTRLPFRMTRWVVRHPFIGTAGAASCFAAVAIALLLLAPGTRAGRNPDPADLKPVELRLRGLMLEAANRHGESVGEVEVSRETAEFLRMNPQNTRDVASLIDADRDGASEVILADRGTAHDAPTPTIRCVALHPARTLWTFEVRRRLDYLYKESTNLTKYIISRMRTGDYDRDGRPEVYVVLNSGSFSSQLVKIDAADGREMGYYVHTGGIPVIEFFDFDGDGVEEIVLGGTNNGWNEAVIAILDPRRVSGQSVHEPMYALRNSVPANERGYIRIPRTVLGRVNPRNARDIIEEIIPNPQTNVLRVGVRDDTQNAAANIAFYVTFRPDLSVAGMERGDGYILVADSLHRSGVLKEPAGEEYLAGHAKKILWWDGGAWSGSPTWNLKAAQPARPL